MGMIKDAIMAGPEALQPLQTSVTTANCSEHGEYESYKTVINGNEIKGCCPGCLEVERQEELRENHETILQRKNVGIFNESCVPRKFQKCSFQNYEVSSQSEPIVEMMKKYVMKFDLVKENGTSFLFTGRTARGKTHLACAVLNNLMRLGRPCIYISSLNYLRKVKRAWVQSENLSEDEIIESYLKYDLMVLDELGKGSLSEKEKGMLFAVITRRYEEGLPTIGITTKTQSQLEKALDEDAVRRLRTGGGSVLSFDWDEYKQTGIL